MSIKNASLIAALVIATAPIASQAGTGPAAAVDACVKSFVDSYLPHRTVRMVKTQGTNDAVTPVLRQRQHKYTVALAAYGADSGTLLAKARCVADNHGIVMVLDSPATNEYVARADFDVRLR